MVGISQGKQKLHLEDLARGHHSSTVPAPGGDDSGGHHSGKAAPAPAGSD